MCDHKCLVRISDIYLHYLRNKKVLKNALCFIMGYLVAMETYVTLF